MFLARTAPTIWFTGLSGAGKTTLARLLAVRLESFGIPYEVIDGDKIRRELSPDLGFSKCDRDENIRRIGFLAQMLNRHGIVAIVAAISPYREMRETIKHNTQQFLEVYVDCAREVLLDRDPKHLYRRAMANEVQQFTGISDVYEAPQSPDLHLRTDLQTPEECVDLIIKRIAELRWLPGMASQNRESELFGWLPRTIAPAAFPLRPFQLFSVIALITASVDCVTRMLWGYSSPTVLLIGILLATLLLGVRFGILAVLLATLFADLLYLPPRWQVTLDRSLWQIAIFYTVVMCFVHLSKVWFSSFRSHRTRFE